MKVKVESDGTPEGTRVILDNGEILTGVQWVQVLLSTDGNEVTMGLQNVPIEIVAEASISKVR